MESTYILQFQTDVFVDEWALILQKHYPSAEISSSYRIRTIDEVSEIFDESGVRHRIVLARNDTESTELIVENWSSINLETSGEREVIREGHQFFLPSGERVLLETAIDDEGTLINELSICQEFDDLPINVVSSHLDKILKSILRHFSTNESENEFESLNIDEIDEDWSNLDIPDYPKMTVEDWILSNLGIIGKVYVEGGGKAAGLAEFLELNEIEEVFDLPPNFHRPNLSNFSPEDRDIARRIAIVKSSFDSARQPSFPFVSSAIDDGRSSGFSELETGSDDHILLIKQLSFSEKSSLKPLEIFPAPSRLDTSLFRVGTDMDGTCLIHSILTATSREYRQHILKKDFSIGRAIRSQLADLIEKPLSHPLSMYDEFGVFQTSMNNETASDFVYRLCPKLLNQGLTMMVDMNFEDISTEMFDSLDFSITRFQKNIINPQQFLGDTEIPFLEVLFGIRIIPFYTEESGLFPSSLLRSATPDPVPHICIYNIPGIHWELLVRSTPAGYQSVFDFRDPLIELAYRVQREGKGIVLNNSSPN